MVGARWGHLAAEGTELPHAALWPCRGVSPALGTCLSPLKAPISSSAIPLYPMCCALGLSAHGEQVNGSALSPPHTDERKSIL